MIVKKELKRKTKTKEEEAVSLSLQFDLLAKHDDLAMVMNWGLKFGDGQFSNEFYLMGCGDIKILCAHENFDLAQRIGSLNNMRESSLV